MRSFNTAGPVRPAKHYAIPPLERLDLGLVLGLMREEKYFVLHAPRQTGKTSVLLALRDLLNTGTEGAYRCVYVNVEAGRRCAKIWRKPCPALLDTLAGQARTTLGDESLEALVPRALEGPGRAGGALGHVLTRWSEADPKPLVLLIDEVDALVGDTLISVLRQRPGGLHGPPGALSAERGSVRGA